MHRRLSCLLFGAALLTGVVRIEAADPPKSPYGMVRLHSLVCNQVSDGLFGGGEEPILRVAGQTVWQMEGARAGKTYDLSKIAPVVFHVKCDIALTERDPGNEDRIGIQEATLKDIGAGKQSVKLAEAGSSYTLTYEVVRAPGRCGQVRLHQLHCLKGVASKAGERDSISVSVDRLTAYSVLSVDAGKAGQTPLAKFEAYPAVAFSEAAAIELGVITEGPKPKTDKLDPRNMAASYRNTTLPSQKALVSLAGKGKHRLIFRTATGAHFEVIFEVLP